MNLLTRDAIKRGLLALLFLAAIIAALYLLTRGDLSTSDKGRQLASAVRVNNPRESIYRIQKKTA